MEQSNVTRKLAAILSADVQSYSRLMGKNEETTLRTLTSYRGIMSSLIEQHYGRVVASQGDNLLAEFGSVVDALQCAVAIQQALAAREQHLPSQRQIWSRIGIDLGDVIVQGEQIYSDGVNIAVGLKGLAEGGGICIAGSVYDQVENKLALTYKLLGEQQVKDIARPIRAYRVRADVPSLVASNPPSEGGRPAEERQQDLGKGQQAAVLVTQPSLLVGRNAELAMLHQRLETALQGQRQVVFISGEPGIGKTALVDAFLTQLQHRTDVRVTSGQCVEQYGPGEAYLPLLEATQRLCRAPGGERRVEALQRYAPSWLAQLPSLLTPQDRALLQQRVQGTNRERMLREMAEAAELFTTRRGLVVVLEDLHWSDVSTLDWVTYIAQRREPCKLLILGTYRPTETLINNHPLRGVVQELLARRQCEELRVTPLEDTAIAAYLRSRFGELASSEALTATLARRTGGNPLFFVNIVDYLVRQGAITDVDGQWIVRAEKVTELAERIPDTLRQLIERQVERLSEAEQRLLEAASVAGVEFTGAEVAAGLQTALEDVEATCGRFARIRQWLRTAGLTEWPDGTVSGCYRFHHALYQEVIYARVAGVRQVQSHRRIAERKEVAYGERTGEIAAELAVHFVEGRYYHKAVQYLQQAGKNAVRRSAHQEAVAHFTRGLDLLATFPDTPERRQHELALQVALGVPLVRIKGYAASEIAHAYGRARELCQQIGEQPELFTALVGLCSFYLVRAELQTARMLAEQCLRLAQHEQDPALLVEAHFILGLTLLYSGELTSAQAILEQGSAFYDPQAHGSLTLVYGQDPGVACRAYASLTKWLLGYPDQALGKNHDALSLARELSHSFSIGAALHTAAWLHQYRREGPAVQAYAEEEIVVSNEGGFALWLAAGTILRGWALSEQGAREEGLAQMREGMAALNATGTAIAQPYQLALLAQTHGKSGQPHEGLALLDQALATVDKTGERYYEAELYRLKGELTLKMVDERWETDNEKRETGDEYTEQTEGFRLKASEPSLVPPSSLLPMASNLSQDSAALSTQDFALFRPEGEYWTLSFAGATCRLKEARGLHYIAHLLQHPHQEFHVITLIGIRTGLSEETAELHSFQDPSLSFDHAEGLSDAGEVLDPQARAAYKRRLLDLEEEIEEARAFNDLGRIERLQEEREFLTRELSHAIGLGGRARRAGSSAERARVNITRAIKLALRKISEHHPALGQHLAATIKTGAYCSYTPDVRMPITWQG